jgi:hypothetical protein
MHGLMREGRGYPALYSTQSFPSTQSLLIIEGENSFKTFFHNIHDNLKYIFWKEKCLKYNGEYDAFNRMGTVI